MDRDKSWNMKDLEKPEEKALFGLAVFTKHHVHNSRAMPNAAILNSLLHLPFNGGRLVRRSLCCPPRRRRRRRRGKAPTRITSNLYGIIIVVQSMSDSLSLTVKFEGPWFTTQLSISLTIGVFSFFIFSYCRTRWPLLFAPRTKLKGLTASSFLISSSLTTTQVSHLMRLMLIRLSLAGSCPPSELRNSQCFRLLA